MTRTIKLGFIRIVLPEKHIDPLDEAARKLRERELLDIRLGRKGVEPSAGSLEQGKRSAKKRAKEIEHNRSNQRENL